MFKVSAFVVGALSLAPCAQAQCTYTVRLYDAGGDGWGGSLLHVTNYSAGSTVDDVITLDTGSQADFVYTAELGDGLTFSYEALGTQEAENSFAILALNGFEIYVSQPAPPTGFICAFSVQVGCNIPPLPPSDCMGGVVVGQMDDTLAFLAPWSNGNIDDLDTQNQGCMAGENTGRWYFLPVLMAGDLSFSIDLIEPSNSEIDFALWGPFPGDYPSIPMCGQLGQPVRCSIATGVLPTGMNDIATDQQEGVAGDGWVEDVAVNWNEYYILYVDRQGFDPAAVSIALTGTAQIGFVITSSDLVNGERSQLTVGPQPTDRILRIGWSGFPASASIVDMQGRTVWNGMIVDRQELDLSTWDTGNYVLHAAGHSMRFVVLH